MGKRRNNEKTLLAFLIIAIAIAALHSSEIVTSYAQDTPIQWSFTNDSGISYLNGYPIAHLGTLTIIIPADQPVYYVYLTEMRYTYATVSGIRSYDGRTRKNTLYIYYVTTINGHQSNWNQLRKSYGYDTPFKIEGNDNSLAGKTVTVDFYIQYYQSKTYYEYNQILTINTDLGLGKVGVTTEPGRISNADKILLPINGGGGAGTDDNTFEIIGGGSVSDEIESGLGETSLINAELSITNVLTGCSLSEITGPDKTKIADLGVKISGSKNNFDLSIVFDDAGASNQFTLRHNTISNVSIPFKIYLGNDEITKGVEYLGWTDVKKNKLETREIRVSGITAAMAESLPSGEYKDTISIEVTLI